MLDRPVHPLLFAAYPPLFLYAHNQGQLAVADVWPSVLLLQALVGVVWLAATVRSRNARAAACFASACLVLTFGHGPVVDLLQERAPMSAQSAIAIVSPLVWLLTIVIAGFLVGRRARTGTALWSGATVVLNVVSAGLVAFPLFSLASAPAVPIEAAPLQATSRAAEPNATPDIYFIVLDGFGSSETLARLYDVDLEPFISSLEAQGFYVARRSRANYAHTMQSLAATLTMAYNPPPPDEFRRGSHALIPFIGRIRSNRVMAMARRHGYSLYSFATGYGNTEIREVDRFLAPQSGLSEFHNVLMGLTPFPMLVARLTRLDPYEKHRLRIEFTLDSLVELGGEPGPKLVFAHLLSPHPPFVFGADGAPVDHDVPFRLADGDDFRRVHSRAAYVQGYADQVRYLSRRLEETVAGILAASASPPIIIVQGDHGPGSELSQDRLDKTNLAERMFVLNALHLPDPELARRLYPELSPVNTFRLIFQHYFEESLPLLRDRSFFNAYSDPHHYIEVTSRLRDAD